MALPPQGLRPDTWLEHQDPVSHTAQKKRVRKKEREREREREREGEKGRKEGRKEIKKEKNKVIKILKIIEN